MSQLEPWGLLLLGFFAELSSGRPRLCAMRSQAIGGRTVVGRDHRSLSHRRRAIVGATSIKDMKIALEEGRTTD